MESLQEKLNKLHNFKKQDQEDLPGDAICCFPLKEPPDDLEEAKFEKCEITGQVESQKRARVATMTLTIETTQTQKFEIRVNPLDTIQEVKEEIFDSLGFQTSDQTLRYQNQTLQPNKTIKQYGIPPGASLQLTIRVKHSCFLPDAPVTLSDGSIKKIKDIKIGELVLSYDTLKMQLCSKKVSDIGVYESDCLCEIALGDRKVVCTPNHPFWVINKGWRAVQPHIGLKSEQLRVGDTLLSSNMKTVEVRAIRNMEMKRNVRVYNLHIDSAHNFFAFGVLVHNTQIYLRINGGNTLALDIELSDPISEIKRVIKEREGIPVDQQCLIFAGKILEDDLTLADYGITKENTLHLYPYCPTQGAEEIDEKDLTVNLNIIYRTTTYLLPSLATMPIKGLKQQITSMVNEKQEVTLLYGGKILIKDENTLRDYNIINNSDIIAIPARSGGDCLRFMQLIEDNQTLDFEFMKSSFEAINNFRMERFGLFLPLASEVIEAQKHLPDFSYLKFTEIFAVMVWTSDVLYDKVNKILRENGDLTNWGTYLKHLITGLKLLPYYVGKCYRGFSNYQNPEVYIKGNIVDWSTISGLSKKKEQALKFCDHKGTFFEVDVVSARDVSRLSVHPEEEEVILMPYSCFEVIDVKKSPKGYMVVNLREIPIPRGKKVIFWVDDNPEYIYYHGQELAKQDISCVFCTSTKDALRIINSFRWILYFDHAEFRIVTDMVRKEDGSLNYTAGVDLLRELFQTYKYNFEVLVFCEDMEKATESCIKAGIEGSYKVTKFDDELLKFINFNS